MTTGGVERCILSRAYLYKKHNLPIKIYAYFLYPDAAVEKKIAGYIQEHQLETHIECISTLKNYNFDVVNIIDTPELFDKFPKIYVECHSTYKESITYLKNLKKNVIKLITPTENIKNTISQNYNIPLENIVVLSNFVMDGYLPSCDKILWNKTPIFYFGRIDPHKNPVELLQIFQACRSESNDFIYILVTNNLIEIIALLKKFPDIIDSLILLPSIGFTKITDFLSLMKAHKGIFISSSKQETFGLSAAEAFATGIPVVLSDNIGHRFVVDQNDSFLYQLGNIEEAKEKILTIKSNYNNLPLNNEYLLKLQYEHIKQLKALINF